MVSYPIADYFSRRLSAESALVTFPWTTKIYKYLLSYDREVRAVNVDHHQ